MPADPVMPLVAGRPYYFWVEIGPPVVGWPSTAVEPAAVRLSVALSTYAGEISIAPGGDVGELELRPDGSVVVAAQAVPAMQLPHDTSLLNHRLWFVVRAPGREGVFRLRCSFYHKNVLVQSREVATAVTRSASRPSRAGSATVDYTLSRTLDRAHLEQIAPHRLSILLNRNSDRDHGLRFFAEQLKADAAVDGQELQELISRTHFALRCAAWGDEEAWQPGKAYRYAGSIDLERLRIDLARLAQAGHRFYAHIADRLCRAGGVAACDALAELLQRPGRIQIATRMSAGHALPAATFYDHPLNDAIDAEAFSLCPEFVAALNRPSPLDELDCFRGSCPSREVEDVVCPSGFWGFRHELGVPPSVTMGPYAPLEIPRDGAPRLAVRADAFSTLKETQTSHWLKPRPLLFSNGTRSSTAAPAIAFASDLVETAQTAGVIGTEITDCEPLAGAFAEQCVRRFLRGATLGEAVRGARLALLQAGDPLGLVYVPFALASLHLQPSQSSRDE